MADMSEDNGIGGSRDTIPEKADAQWWRGTVQ
jgi:hypothetical protein